MTKIPQHNPGPTHQFKRDDAIWHQGREIVPTIYGEKSGNTVWVSNLEEMRRVGGGMAFNEDQTEITLHLPEGHKFGIRFNEGGGDVFSNALRGDNLDRAVKTIMDALGITTGDIAAQEFSGVDIKTYATLVPTARAEFLKSWLFAELDAAAEQVRGSKVIA